MSTLFYEDLKVGQSFVSAGRTITEADLTIFAMVSADWHPVHVDAEYARGTSFGQRIVHGPLGIALALGFFSRLGLFDKSAIALLNIQLWRFELPIFVNDTLHLEMRIAGKRLTRKRDCGIIDRDMQLIRQDGKAVQQGRMGLMIARRPPSAHKPK